MPDSLCSRSFDIFKNIFLILSKVRSLDLLPNDQRITTAEYSKLRHSKGNILLDVRPHSEFEICHLSEAISKLF